ncbi:MAG TPA: isoprenylcysteine carboxylmethyltransferase family protein [Burkholderiales bacterium]|nr:isoprenylcysteine carboxylmethyltransferase family protein [Burkholderiales bacterium]
MKAIVAVAYGLASYFFFAGTFLYMIGFVSNSFVPKSIDSGAPVPLAEALVVNLLLLGVFAVQHSVMARPAFKRWWTRIVPESVERSTYVLAATLALALLMWQWRPIAQPVIWSVENLEVSISLKNLFWIGWAVLLTSTFLINHFELFGLRQVFARLLDRKIPEPEFRTPFLYRYVRHPIYLGFLMSFWATPHMSAGHLLFALGTTGYILVGIYFEERDLVAQFGNRYRLYKQQVGMLLPWVARRDKVRLRDVPQARAGHD